MNKVPVARIKVETVEGPVVVCAIVAGEPVPNLKACERLAKKAAAKARKAYLFFDVEVLPMPYDTAWQATKDYTANAFRAV
jgi:hypothetical protein